MKRKALIDLGLSEEQVDAIMAMYGESTNQLKLDKGLVDAEVIRVTELLTEANAKIEEYKGMGDIAAIQQSADEWKTKYEQGETAHANALKKIKYDNALTDALKAQKVKDPSDVIHALKTETIVLGDDGKFVGLEDQLKPLKESKPYLFSDAKEPPTVVLGGGNDVVLTDAFTESARKAAGLPSAE